MLCMGENPDPRALWARLLTGGTGGSAESSSLTSSTASHFKQRQKHRVLRFSRGSPCFSMRRRYGVKLYTHKLTDLFTIRLSEAALISGFLDGRSDP
jgi:hypothetical protein